MRNNKPGKGGKGKGKNPKKFKLYQDHPVHGRIPNWKQVVRCNCCGEIYRARLLTPNEIDQAQHQTFEHETDRRCLGVPYGECPRCFAINVAEFSTS